LMFGAEFTTDARMAADDGVYPCMAV